MEYILLFSLILKFADDVEAFILIYPTASLHFSYHNHPIMDHIAMLNNGLLPNPMAQRSSRDYLPQNLSFNAVQNLLNANLHSFSVQHLLS